MRSIAIVVLLVFIGVVTEPAHGHTAYGHCNGPPALKADYPHETTYGGSPVVKGKVGGACTMPHENVYWNLYSYLWRVRCPYDDWGYCYVIRVDSNGPKRIDGQNAYWDRNDAPVTSPCHADFHSAYYQTSLKVTVNTTTQDPPHSGDSLRRYSAWRYINCAD